MAFGVVERLVVLMSFQTEADSLGSRLHMKGKAKPLVTGVLLLVVVVFAAIAWSSCSAGGFSVERAAAIREASGDSDSSGGETVDVSMAEGGEGFDKAESAESAQAKTFFVHVGGAVRAPGLYELREGLRVAAAIEAAGGFSSDAATDAVNLAQELSDGEQIIVPTEEEYANGHAGREFGTGTVSEGANSSIASGLVNINTATVSELDALPGIGESTARKIVADRSANGPFKTIEDLKRVSGIGDKKYEQLAGLICV